MRKYLIILALVILAVVIALYFLFSSKAELTKEIPEVFRGQSITYMTNEGRTFIASQPGGSIFPIIHDSNALYVLSGTKDTVKKYYIDKENKELVIEQKTTKKTRDGSFFQLVTVPADKYQPIVEDNKIKVRIKFNYLDNQSIYLVYDLENKKANMIEPDLLTNEN